MNRLQPVRGAHHETSHGTQHDTDEAGAVAVLVALLATVLLLVAALAVDLGNAWARKRDIQTQVDVVALAAGGWARDNAKFPATDDAKRRDIRATVATYLRSAGNDVIGQELPDQTTLTTRLGNGNRSDGEVVFTPDGTSFEVVAPLATVDVGLGALAGADDIDVQATAGIGVFSELPPRNDLLPFWLPNGCLYGPAEADTSNGGGTGGGGGSSTDTNGSYAGPGVNQSAAQSFQSTDEDNSHDQYTTETFTFRVVHPGNLQRNNGGQTIGDPTVHFQLRDDSSVRYSIPGTWVSTPRNQQVWTFRITIEPDDVTSRSVQWYYQTQVGSLYSNVNNMNIQTKPAPPTGGSTSCVGATRGNFGQLDSPRKDVNGNNNRLAHNIAFGLDHQLEPLVNAAADECANRPATTTPLRKAEQHDDVSRNGNNCILADPGNDGPKIYDGLVTGVGGKPGRLDAANGATRSGCNGGNAVLGGRSVNNDLLSCYMENASDPLSRLTTTSGVTTGILDPAVTRSPRFVWLPVVYRSDRSSKDFQPILRFVPGFITDESTTSTRTTPAFVDTSRDNGVQVNGNSVKVLTVFTFNPAALPVGETSPYTTFDPTVGRAMVKLTK